MRTVAPESYEDALRNFLVAALYARVGEPGSLRGEGKSAHFEIKKSLGGGTCGAEGALDYELPSGRKLSHRNDVLISLPGKQFITIELKWAESRTSAFKARAYDMIHLKKSFGEKLRGVLVYLRTGQGGLTLDHARDVAYPFDIFFGLEHQDPQNPTIWTPVLDRIEAEIMSH